MRQILVFSDILARLCAGIARVGSWLIIPLVLVIVYDVVTRKIIFIQQMVMNSWLYDFISPTKLQEMEWHLHAMIFLMAYALAYLNGAHVRVDLWRDKQTERRRGWIELLSILIFALPFCGVLVYEAWVFVVNAYVQGEGSAALTGIPHRWVIKSVLLLGVALLFVSLLATLMRLCIFLFGPSALRPEALARLGMVQLPAATTAPEASKEQ